MSEIVVSDVGFLSPVADLETAKRAYQSMRDFVEDIMREEVDYGTIPGTSKPTLLKPGAEKLLRYFGMQTNLVELEKVEDWTGEDHDDEPFFFYRYKAQALRGNQVVAEGIGSCNSWEKKYRYRTAKLECPECGEPLRKSKFSDGYYCWDQKGGCGAEIAADDPRITEQPRGTVQNPDIADVVNTVDKMAQKRAIVAVALVACNASEYFTQDIEDLSYIEGSYKIVDQNKVDPEVIARAAKEMGPDYFTQDKQTRKPSKGVQSVSKANNTVTNTKTLKPKKDGLQDVTTDPGKKPDFSKRPYDPETLREALLKKAHDMKPASDKQVQLLASLFSQYFQDDGKVAEAKRYLFGTPHLRDADRKLVNAAMSWADIHQDDGGEYRMGDLASKELSKVLDAAAIEDGQMKLVS